MQIGAAFRSQTKFEFYGTLVVLVTDLEGERIVADPSELQKPGGLTRWSVRLVVDLGFDQVAVFIGVQLAGAAR